MPSTPILFENLNQTALIEKAIENQEGILSHTGALFVETGSRTGRSPYDRFIVEEPSTSEHIVWGEINRTFSPQHFDQLWQDVEGHMSQRHSYVSHVHIGADEEHYLP
ncbi:MAG: phosphoenolpyruvate carboxykinase (ATP), partial [Gammaproteobacteria bacterium]